MLFVITTWLILRGSTLFAFDIPVTRVRPGVRLGAPGPLVNVTNITGGLLQDTFGVLVAILLFLFWVPERWLPSPSWRWASWRRTGARD